MPVEGIATETGHALVLAERRGQHVLLLRINRPSRRNAFDHATALALESAIDSYEADPDLRVAVLTGSGGVFSAGQDLKAVAEEGLARGPGRGVFGLLNKPPRKPLIAAVEGHALGGGFELCLACDLVVASRTAMMGLPEAARGLLAVGGGVLRLPKRIPYHVAMELCLTGTAWPAPEFHRLGLVSRLADEGRALDVALQLASEVTSSGPLAVLASAEIVRRAYDWTNEEGWDRQREFTDPVMTSEDFREGLAAFAEKREPQWKGR